MRSQGWKDMMDFSSREKRGVVVLLSLLVLLIIIRFWQPWDKSADKYDFTGYEADIDGFEASLKEDRQNRYEYTGRSESNYKREKDKQKNKPDVPKFNFNPNAVTRDEMKNLGFSDKLIRDVENYRNAGGSFSSPADMKKLYNIDEEFYAAIEPYISLPMNSETEVYFKFDPNTISSDSLKLLGFPENIAERWVKYRKSSGGFSDVEDVLKLYGIDTSHVKKLEEFMLFPDRELSVSEFVKPDLNSCEYRELLAVEGINPGIVSKVISYRNLLGGYVDYQQLHEVYDMDEENFNLLKEFTIIDNTKLIRISLNEADYKDFLRHPYLNKKDVSGILRYRDFQSRIKRSFRTSKE